MYIFFLLNKYKVKILDRPILPLEPTPAPPARLTRAAIAQSTPASQTPTPRRSATQGSAIARLTNTKCKILAAALPKQPVRTVPAIAMGTERHRESRSPLTGYPTG
ncbi:hypothetical protein [Trichothermofontia sp.]